VGFFTGKYKLLRIYVRGSYFGEIEMFKSCSRQHYVNALEETDVLLLPKDIFMSELKNFSKEEEMMYFRAIERDIFNKKTANQIGNELTFKSTYVKSTRRISFGFSRNTRITRRLIF
jgi:signal-transduction protein with cAMP-binding, CBS, and nucleotidyltransferase domain